MVQPLNEQASKAGTLNGVSAAASPLRTRLTVMALLVLCAGLLGMSARVAWLVSGRAKGPDNTELRALYERQHTARIPLTARRGDILDCRGRCLASSIEVPSVFADPAIIDDVEAAAARLQDALGVPAAEIATVITARKEKRFAWLRRQVSEQQAQAVQALKIPGIGILREPSRSYPNGPVAAHVLGYVGIDEDGRTDAKGLAGVELKYDEKLRGEDGYKICTKDAAGRILSLVPNGYKPARDGCSVVLTIDSFIQSVAEQHLQDAVDQFQAQSGVAIVMEPATGQVLALACRPTFDPNHFRESPESALTNRALVGPFEPGSIFKPLVMAAAVQEGYAHPGEIIFCHNGVYITGSRRLRDAHPYGSLTLEQVIGKSSNIGMAIIGERMGNPLMWHYLTQFGLGQKTNIDLPGEDVGILLPLKKWTRFSTDSIPMGAGGGCHADPDADGLQRDHQWRHAPGTDGHPRGHSAGRPGDPGSARAESGSQGHRSGGIGLPDQRDAQGRDQRGHGQPCQAAPLAGGRQDGHGSDRPAGRWRLRAGRVRRLVRLRRSGRQAAGQRRRDDLSPQPADRVLWRHGGCAGGEQDPGCGPGLSQRAGRCDAAAI